MMKQNKLITPLRTNQGELHTLPNFKGKLSKRESELIKKEIADKQYLNAPRARLFT